jgi:hypothetical protein
MTLEIRKNLARESFEGKIRKVSQLLRLVKIFSRRQMKAESKEFSEKGGSALIWSAATCRRFPTPRHVAVFQSAGLPAYSKFGHYQKSSEVYARA